MGIAASIATITRVVLQVLPEDGGCANISASLERIRVQPNIDFADFLDQANLPSKVCKRPAARVRQRVFADTSSTATAATTSVKWSMFDSETERIVDDPALRNRPALDIEPSTCRTRLRSAIWTPPTEAGARRFVRLILVDENGQVLAETRTPQIGPTA
jgi:hypothetical protein